MKLGVARWLGALLIIVALVTGSAGTAQTAKRENSAAQAEKTGQADKVDKPAKADSTDAKDTSPVWLADLSKATIPQKPASGRLHGEPFTIERAELQQGTLSLRQGHEFFADLEFKLFLFVNSYTQLEGQFLDILDEENPPVKTVPHIYMSWKPDPKSLPKSKTWTGDYVIRLKFDKARNGRLPGQIYLCLPDMKQSFVAGTFEAIIK
jgi:hypothetical protein